MVLINIKIYMTSEQTQIFLLASSVGATIILSRGDIIKPFRDCLSRKSIKTKFMVHDFSIPLDKEMAYIIIDSSTVYFNSDRTIAPLPPELERNWISTSSEIEDDKVRYFMHFRRPHTILFFDKVSLVSGKEITCNVYERTLYKPFIKYISELFGCPQCLGLWVGCAWYGAYLFGAMSYWGWRLFCFGCIVSAVAYLYFKLYTFLEKK